MSAQNAPLPLINQVNQAAGGTIVVTIPLQSLGPAPGFVVGAAGFNNGNPTLTVTYTIPAPQAGGVGSPLPDEVVQLLSAVEDLVGSGQAVAT